jgi:hypothetical protein
VSRVSTAREQLEERGWTVFPSVIDSARCDAFLAEVERLWSVLGRPALYSRSDIPCGADAVVCAVGLAMHRLLDRIPASRDLLLPDPVASLVASVLGADYRLEVASAILCDETRPFLFWHHHVGGIVDAKDYGKQEVRYPTFQRIERLSCTFYPVPLDDAHGVMLVHPRRVTDPTDPPYPDMEGPWPVQETIRCPPGSVVVADQSVWHAITPMASKGRRAFGAGFIAPSTRRRS